MATEYQIRIRDDAGALIEVFGMGMPDISDGNVVSPFSYSKGLYTPGILTIRLNGDHPAISSLTENAQVEVWRNVDANGWYLDFVGIYFNDYDYIYQTSLDFVAYIPGSKVLLTHAINAWLAGTTNKSKFANAKAETIMKTVLNYNMTGNATTGNGRELTWQGPFTLDYAADAAGGNALNWGNSWKQLLDDFEELCLIGGGDYDLIRDPDDDGSFLKFELRWYTGQRGRDLSASMILAVSRDNMTNVVYQHRGGQITTAAIVGGQGVAADRDIEIRTSTGNGATIHREAFVHATHIDKGDTAELQDKGDLFLDEHRILEKFSFDILQSEATIYGVDYGINAGGSLGVLGDLITVIRPHDDANQTHKITKVSISVDKTGKEAVRVETEEQ